MNPSNIELAKHEANRFLKAVGEYDRKTKLLEADYKKRLKDALGTDRWVFRENPHVEHAAVKRASLDLTRALAKMRTQQ